MLDTLKKFAQKTVALADGRPLVFLGRDTWPCVPFLRIQGIQCQYFLFSRLQTTDLPTRNQWLREIPPGAFVCDTGFQGSLMAILKGIDSTIAGGVLMSASEDAYADVFDTHFTYRRHYPLWYETNRQKVLELEHLPKLINRTISYDNGCAIESKTDNEERGTLPESQVVLRNYLLLRELGLSQKDARYYSSFTGLFANERIGCAFSKVSSHYASVAKKRKQHGDFDLVLYLTTLDPCRPLTLEQKEFLYDKIDNNRTEDWENLPNLSPNLPHIQFVRNRLLTNCIRM